MLHTSYLRKRACGSVFIDEETESLKLYNRPKVTQLVAVDAGFEPGWLTPEPIDKNRSINRNKVICIIILKTII